ncbi:phospholipid carrier-dependent glycosyltransferase [Marinimicrobium sp. ABcell2]|uniref:phospholipid carrier-dependent glycosyltransferase n=1 Tax=Marinimicrobium sp. ABcell2 TaxID=3069751 RepID=UPI0027B7B030|nr:phospholipid carrier-dependent glycosyltransferase [Marinimicrobium sp. ABcell2]MDQ2077193.1 phospholipid carrier-dependent glycosyltransferase [Marinimicrobium sp. ABcell2]
MLATLKTYHRFAYPLLLLTVSLLVYMTAYTSPRALFWDENYHVTSAQKHLDGVMYMETHPPLGKMLMAASEGLLGVNAELDKSALTRTSHISGEALPENFSFAGMRLPSTLLMALSVLFMYGILYRLTGHRLVAVAFSCLLIFDNALVVHSRAAMLEGIQLFFILAAIYYLVRTVTHTAPIRLRHYAILGALVGLTVSVKANGAIVLLLLVVLFFVDQWSNIKALRVLPVVKRLATSVPSAVAPLVMVFLSTFYVHIATGTEIAGNQRYKASPEYLTHIREGTTHTLSGFTVGMRDQWRFMAEYSDGVPRLDICKPGENGSPAFAWPGGTKSISYRWDREEVDGQVKVAHIYLVANPMVWFSALLGIVLSVGLLISRYVYGNPVKDVRLFGWIAVFTGLYLSYMIVMLQIERVMYLYHYLVPLVFAIINLALVFTYIFRAQILTNNRHTLINLGIFVALVIAVFAYFSPLTYGIPITPEQFEQRQWFDFWMMQVVR